jgi:hypothetical protein
MQSILLFSPDDRPFELAAIQRVFQSEPRFRDVRFNEPGGAVIEADYVEPEGRTIVGLSGSRTSISFSGISDATLRAVLILQRNLDTPLRMVDTNYSFDLILQDFPNVETLWNAIQNAQTS